MRRYTQTKGNVRRVNLRYLPLILLLLLALGSGFALSYIVVSRLDEWLALLLFGVLLGWIIAVPSAVLVTLWFQRRPRLPERGADPFNRPARSPYPPSQRRPRSAIMDEDWPSAM